MVMSGVVVHWVVAPAGFGFGSGVERKLPLACVPGFVLNRRLLPEMHILYSLITFNETTNICQCPLG